MAEKKTTKTSDAPAASAPAEKPAVSRAVEKRRARNAALPKPKAENPFSQARPYRTYSAPKNGVARDWYVVDADGLSLGRAASRIAFILRGKHKPVFTPHTDTGDFIVVVNAEKIRLTGKKEEQKKYYNHSLFPGGLRTRSAKELRAKKPEEILRRAVQRMLPRGPLGRRQFGKLKVYVGPSHPHAAQQPKRLTLPL